MEKKLNKPHEKNERLKRPCGRLGVPPDPKSAHLTIISGGTVIIISGDCRILDRGRPGSLPQ